MEQSNIEKICDEKHKSIDEKICRHERWLGEHETKIDGLVKSDAINTTEIHTLCRQIGNQTRAIWGLVSGIGFVLLGFLIWYIQTLKR